MTITVDLVKELRQKTGSGVMDAKRALVEVKGDIEKAIALLRERGVAKAAKKADRVAAEGLTGIYVQGDVASIVEVNSETDFVAKNSQFIELVNETARLIAKEKPANNEEALSLTTLDGRTLESVYIEATATIGEKILFRRFAIAEKTSDQVFGIYQHNGGRISAITVISSSDKSLAKSIAMHVAAMKPIVLSYKELDSQFINAELAELNRQIREENENRLIVGKPELPCLKYGSRAQLTDQVLASEEEMIRTDLVAEGKTEKILEKAIQGKMNRFLLDNTRVDQIYTLLAQSYILDDSMTIEDLLGGSGAEIVSFIRFGVGDGIDRTVNNFESEVTKTMSLALGQNKK